MLAITQSLTLVTELLTTVAPALTVTALTARKQHHEQKQNKKKQ